MQLVSQSIFTGVLVCHILERVLQMKVNMGVNGFAPMLLKHGGGQMRSSLGQILRCGGNRFRHCQSVVIF